MMDRFWRWHSRSAFQVVPVLGGMSMGEIMTISPKALAAKFFAWISTPKDEVSPTETPEEAELRKFYEACAEAVEVCEIEDDHTCDTGKHLSMRDWFELVNTKGAERGFDMTPEEIMAELRREGFSHI